MVVKATPTVARSRANARTSCYYSIILSGCQYKFAMIFKFFILYTHTGAKKMTKPQKNKNIMSTSIYGKTGGYTIKEEKTPYGFDALMAS